MRKFKVGDNIERTSRPRKWAPIGFITTVEDDYTYTDADGASGVLINSNDWSLATEGPVRTVTRREIVPGAYGGVKVGRVISSRAQVCIRFDGWKGADELRSAAMILSQIAEALDDKETTK